jgi:hypothetical protein
MKCSLQCKVENEAEASVVPLARPGEESRHAFAPQQREPVHHIFSQQQEQRPTSYSMSKREERELGGRSTEAAVSVSPYL